MSGIWHGINVAATEMTLARINKRLAEGLERIDAERLAVPVETPKAAYDPRQGGISQDTWDRDHNNGLDAVLASSLDNVAGELAQAAQEQAREAEARDMAAGFTED